MQRLCPSYMTQPLEVRRALRFLWDDSRASDDFEYDSMWVLEAADACSLRAQMALCVGLYEWTVWRFDGLHSRDEPRLVLDAAWRAVAQPDVVDFFELTRADWQGPVLGPLWCGITWLYPAVAHADRELSEVADGLHYLTRLAVHVSNEPARVVGWLQHVLPRLISLSPARPFDIFEDLFDERIDERRGAQVTRSMLNPDATLFGNAAIAAEVEATLRHAAGDANPFLLRR